MSQYYENLGALREHIRVLTFLNRITDIEAELMTQVINTVRNDIKEILEVNRILEDKLEELEQDNKSSKWTDFEPTVKSDLNLILFYLKEIKLKLE